jgi:hypothetical protein
LPLAWTSASRKMLPRLSLKAREAAGQTLSSTAFLAAFLGGIFVLTSWAAPQETPTPEASIFEGTWTATVGRSSTLHGRWIGQAIPGDPRSAHGSWTLTGPQGKASLTGTWSARKTALGWRGSWSAKVATGRSSAGTWQADLPADPKSTLQDFLERLSEAEIAGTWRSSRLAGLWWLNGKARPASRHPAG